MDIGSKIRFGIIGCSQVAQTGMLPAMRDSISVDSVMVASRNPEKAKEVSMKSGADAWGTYEDVLKNKDIDAIYISLPNALHEEWSIKAAEAGKHVICEKPAALSYDSAKRMVEAAKKNKVRLMEGLMFHYHPQHEKVREFIKQGALGKLMRFDGCFGIPGSGKGVNLLNKDLGGGSFNYQMPYPVYASRMIFGEEPTSVLCKIGFDSGSGVDLRADMILFYSGGKIAFASTLFGSYFHSAYSVLGTNAFIRMKRAYAIPRDMATKIFLDIGDETKEIFVEPADHFKLMLDDFCGEILKREESKKNYEADLLAQARILQAARISDKEKRLVNISEVQ